MQISNLTHKHEYTDRNNHKDAIDRVNIKFSTSINTTAYQEETKQHHKIKLWFLIKENNARGHLFVPQGIQE